MRKIYQKYFEVPEENKGIMGERVFFARLTVAIACIVLCMSAMGLSAYAFFTASVSSDMNQIQAASFDLEVRKIEPQTETASASHESEKTYKLQPGTYSFLLKRVEDVNSAKTGYCEILIYDDEGNSQSVYTQQFGKVQGQEQPVNERTVQITVEKETVVRFVPCWGTYSGTDALDEQTKIIKVDTTKVVSVIDILSTTTTNEAIQKMENPTPETKTTTTQTTAPTELTEPTNSTEPASKTEEEKDDMVVESIEENNGTTTESAESAEDTTSLTKTQE